MQEQWTRWEPIQGLSGNYNIISCHDDYETGLTIVLRDMDVPKRQLRVVWKKSVTAYKKTEERLTVMVIADLRERYELSFYRNWTFFKITNSKYFQELLEESGGLIDYTPACEHFVIFSSEILMDVITNYEPEITFVNVP